jgi:hypothetical protein
MGLWAYLCCFGALVLGFVSNKNPKELRYPFDGFVDLVAYFYLAFALRLLRQVPLHLGFASCHDLGLNY